MAGRVLLPEPFLGIPLHSQRVISCSPRRCPNPRPVALWGGPGTLPDPGRSQLMDMLPLSWGRATQASPMTRLFTIPGSPDCYFYVKGMDSSRTRRGLLRPEPEQTDPQLGRRPQASCGWPRWEHPRTLCQGPCLVMGQSPAWHEHGARVTLSGQQCWGLCPESPEHQMFTSTQNPAVSALQLLLPEPPAPRTFSKVP